MISSKNFAPVHNNFKGATLILWVVRIWMEIGFWEIWLGKLDFEWKRVWILGWAYFRETSLKQRS